MTWRIQSENMSKKREDHGTLRIIDDDSLKSAGYKTFFYVHGDPQYRRQLVFPIAILEQTLPFFAEMADVDF